MAENKSNGFGIASLVLGIISIACFFLVFYLEVIIVLGLVSGILGIVFSVKQKKIFPNGIATAGLGTSIIGLILSALWSILALLYWAILSSGSLVW